jgi:hypothetical protein
MLRIIRAVTWAWIIIVGGLLITPTGIFCIVCGQTLDVAGYVGRPAVTAIGVISIVLGIVGLATMSRSVSGSVR